MRVLTAMLVASVAMMAIVAFSPSTVNAQTVAASNPVVLSGVMADRVVGAESAVPAVQVFRRGWRSGFYGGGYYPYSWDYSPYRSYYYYPYRSYRYYSSPYKTCWWNGWTTVCG
jgi:hypothetical protein